MTIRKGFVLGSMAALLCSTSLAMAGGHTWDVREVFSNADGTIQYIELREMGGGDGETNLNGKKVTSQATGNEFAFPGNAAAPTGNKAILLATAGFAALPGAPTPDHIIVDNFFDAVNGDTLRFHTHDTWVIGAGTVPLDCVNSLHDGSGAGLNSPENYAGVTGSVDCTPPPDCPADLTDSAGGPPDGQIDVFDLLALLANWNTNGLGADIAPPTNIVDVFDLLDLLAAWNMCP